MRSLEEARGQLQLPEGEGASQAHDKERVHVRLHTRKSWAVVGIKDGVDLH